MLEIQLKNTPTGKSLEMFRTKYLPIASGLGVLRINIYLSTQYSTIKEMAVMGYAMGKIGP